MADVNLPRWEVWARFRFSVVGGLLSGPSGNSVGGRDHVESTEVKEDRGPEPLRAFLKFEVSDHRGCGVPWSPLN